MRTSKVKNKLYRSNKTGDYKLVKHYPITDEIAITNINEDQVNKYINKLNKQVKQL